MKSDQFDRRARVHCLLSLVALISFYSSNVGAGVIIPASCAEGCTMPLPCKEAVEQKVENKLVWEPCQIAKYGHGDAEQAADKQKLQSTKYDEFARQGIIQKYNEQMFINVEQMYEKDNGHSTYCSLVPNEFVPGREKLTNHIGKSCGKYAQLEVLFTYKWCKIPLGPKYACGFSDGPRTIYHNRLPLATLEGSYLKSAMLLIMSCEKAAVKGMLEGNTITVGGGACRDAAGKYLSSLQLLDRYGTNHRYDVDCQAFWDKNSAANLGEQYQKAQNALDQGEGKQSSQQICAVREYSKAMAANLAGCETMNRAISKYLKRIGDQDQQEAIFKEVDKKVSDVCVAECINKYPPTLSTAMNPPSPQEISACANACYQREIDRVMEDLLRSRAGKC